MQLSFQATFLHCQQHLQAQTLRARSVPASCGSLHGEGPVDFFAPERSYITNLLDRTEALRDKISRISKHRGGQITSKALADTCASSQQFNDKRSRFFSDLSTQPGTSPVASARTASPASGNTSANETAVPSQRRSTGKTQESAKIMASRWCTSQRQSRRPQDSEWCNQEVKKADLEPSQGVSLVASDQITTIMICNIPCSTKSTDVEIALESMGLDGTYDFLNLPGRHNAQSNLGYAFVNFYTPEDATLCMHRFTGFRFPNTRSTKVCNVKPARIQGSEANMQQLKK